MDEIYEIINKKLNSTLDNSKLIEMYYEVGLVISSKNINTKQLALFLKNKYGVNVVFSQRNLNNMVKFSNYNPFLLDKLKLITWKNILVLMKEDNDLIDICIKYKPTKKELVEYIKTGKELKINKEIELDDTLEELLKLQKKI